MGKTKKSPGDLEELASITDAIQKLYDGRCTIIFELEKDEYDKTLSLFRDVDRNNKKFKIDISGTEFIFILIEDDV